jgi:hypothetical protein
MNKCRHCKQCSCVRNAKHHTTCEHFSDGGGGFGGFGGGGVDDDDDDFVTEVGWPPSFQASAHQQRLPLGDFFWTWRPTQQPSQPEQSVGGGISDQEVVGDVVVERKTLGDLASRSARSHGRAHLKQCHKLVGAGFKSALLLVEGNPEVAIRGQFSIMDAAVGEFGELEKEKGEGGSGGQPSKLDLFRSLSEVLVRFDGRVAVVLTPSLDATADTMRALTLLAKPFTSTTSSSEGGAAAAVAGAAAAAAAAAASAAAPAPAPEPAAVVTWGALKELARRLPSEAVLKGALTTAGVSEESSLKLSEHFGCLGALRAAFQPCSSSSRGDNGDDDSTCATLLFPLCSRSISTSTTAHDDDDSRCAAQVALGRTLRCAPLLANIHDSSTSSSAPKRRAVVTASAVWQDEVQSEFEETALEIAVGDIPLDSIQEVSGGWGGDRGGGSSGPICSGKATKQTPVVEARIHVEAPFGLHGSIIKTSREYRVLVVDAKVHEHSNTDD